MIFPMPWPLDSLDSSPMMAFSFTQPRPLIPWLYLRSWHDHVQHTLSYSNIKYHHLLLSSSLFVALFFALLSPFSPWLHSGPITLITLWIHSELSYSSLSTDHVWESPDLGSNQTFLYISSPGPDCLKSARKTTNTLLVSL